MAPTPSLTAFWLRRELRGPWRSLLEPVEPPYESALLRDVEALPLLLGGFLALLATGAVGHAPAARPGHRAARLRVGHVLRTE